MFRRSIYFFLLGPFLLAACGRHDMPRSPSAPPSRTVQPAPLDEAWIQRWWLAKTVRILRGGQGLTTEDAVSRWLSLPRDRVVAELLDDPRFGDMVLSFNTFFLGMPMNAVRDEHGIYKKDVFNMPEAITSARAVLEGKDYLSLLDLYHPPYYGPLPPPLIKDHGEERTPPDTLRIRHFKKTQAELKALAAEALSSHTPAQASGESVTPAVKVDKLCARFKEHADFRYLNDWWGMPHFMAGGFMMGPQWYGRVLRLCEKGNATPSEFADAIKSVIARNALLFKRFAEMRPALKKASVVTEIPILDSAGLDPDYRFNVLQSLPRGTIVNTNTNLNRKRAGYFLKRYFCDNLTPVSVQIPAAHANSRHASDPACLSCHYKLDPIAGFFRYFGRGFEDFTGLPYIYFDDKVKGDLASYIKNWEAPPDSHRKWSIGYIRSVQDESLNDYGESLPDLFAIFRRAPEVKHCLVQRMYEYLVSDDQAVDGDYLDYLTEKFNENLKESSVGALKALISEIVLNRSYSTPNLNAGECYDYRPGHRPADDSPPCQVASIVKHSCIGCHHSVHDAPYLDMSHFRRLADGSLGFPHLGADGRPIAAKITWHQIADRLMSIDPNVRMPYLTDMPNTDRQSLYSWANSEEAR